MLGRGRREIDLMALILGGLVFAIGTTRALFQDWKCAGFDASVDDLSQRCAHGVSCLLGMLSGPAALFEIVATSKLCKSASWIVWVSSGKVYFCYPGRDVMIKVHSCCSSERR